MDQAAPGDCHGHTDAPDIAADLAAHCVVRRAGHPALLQQLEYHLEKLAAGEEVYNWVLAPRSGDSEAIGNVHFRPWSDSPKGNRGFWLAEPYWNRGLMTEAVAAVNEFAFRTLGVESFYVCNAATNEASRRVKQKTGAEFAGYIELLHHNGQSTAEKWRVSRENWLRRNPSRRG
jgi:[ribosomal protein S5]-alanine N-acetyltransferase